MPPGAADHSPLAVDELRERYQIEPTEAAQEQWFGVVRSRSTNRN